MMTVVLGIEVERQRQRLKRRPQYRLPLAIPQGPDFNLEMFNESWAFEFLRYYRSGICINDKTATNSVPWYDAVEYACRDTLFTRYQWV